MPYKQGKYKHIRYQNPNQIQFGTFRTVPISHTKSRFVEEYPEAKAVVGRSKKTNKWIIQKILIPKRDK